MKCASKHETKQCTLDISSPNIKCHNCGENHMANDPKCSVYISFINNKTDKINNQNKKNTISNQPRNSYPNINTCNTHKTFANTYADAVKTTGHCQCNHSSKGPEVIQPQTPAASSLKDVSCDKNISRYTSEVNKIVETTCVSLVEALNKILETLKLINESVRSDTSENKLNKLLKDSKNCINKEKSVKSVEKPKNIIVTNCKVNEAGVGDKPRSLPAIIPKNPTNKLIDKSKVNIDINKVINKTIAVNKTSKITKSNEKKSRSSNG